MDPTSLPPTAQYSDIWKTILARIEATLSRPSFLTWFKGTHILNIAGDAMVVAAPNGFAKDWLQNKYHKTLLHIVRELLPDIRDVSYVVNKSNTAPDPSPSPLRKQRANTPRHMQSDSAMKELLVNPETNLNPRYTFANFIVGSFNEVAHAAAQSVIKNLGAAYNPLFIYGGVGLGKTHLVQAIGNAVLTETPSARVRYSTGERFMTEVVDALKNQDMNTLKEKYRGFDLLMVDDVQFLARTEKIQEEFFHIFNALYQKNHQIILSSDKPPQAIPTLEDRLRSRFEGGMIADVGLPDVETRFLIVSIKAKERGDTITQDVLRSIAEHIKTNVRDLEGALNRVAIASRMSRAPITADDARRILASHQNAPAKYTSIKKIIRAVADFYDIPEQNLLHHSRKKEVVRPRQIAMYIMREELKASYPTIGERFGGRDHTTAIHSCAKIAKELSINPDLEEHIRLIKDKIFSV